MRVLLVLAFFAALFSVASASHYRYGTIYWETTGTNTVNFTIETAWRKSYWPAGTTVGSTLALQSFYFGDGTSASSFNSVVTTVNNLEDWIISIAFITHTYKTPANGNAPWTAYFTNNARIGNLRNNANQPWFLTTTVDASLVGSPRSKMLPIANVLLLQNNITTFNVPAVTDDNSQIHYTMGTATQICGPGKSCTNPPKMTVDASSGTVTWDLSTITPGLWTAVIMISNDRVSVPVDFIINYTRVAGQCASNCSKPGTTCFLPSDCGNCPSTNQCVKPQPPSICNPTPSNKVPYAANFGTPISFNISAVDAQPNAKVFIQEGSLPATATLSPPMGTNPVVRTFSWLPETEGASIFCFSATDSNMLTTPQYCITIEVSLGCSPACEGYADCIKGTCVCQQGYSGANCSVFGGDIVDGETAFGSVAMHGSNFYSFMPIAGNAIKIILETVESSYSTALFVSTTVQQPTITSKTWSSIAEDPNSIVITPTDPNYDANATFHLAVFGWYSSFSNMIDYNLTVFLS